MEPNQAKPVSFLKDRLGFILCMTGIVGLLLIAYFKGIDASNPIVMIIASFIGGKAYQNTVMVQSAAQDKAADTVKAIEEMDK